MSVDYVTSPAELAGSILAYQAEMAHLSAYEDKIQDDAKQALSHANVFIAISDGLGGYLVGPVKHVGHVGMTLAYYADHRALPQTDKLRINGSEAERHVRSLGGTLVSIGWAANAPKVVGHPAVAAVRGYCAQFGKKPSAKAVVRVFDNISPDTALGESDPILDVLAAAINAAGLSEGALENLFSRVKVATSA
jgi:hypothetical protein